MMNKTERAEFEQIKNENNRLHKQVDRLLDERGKAQETICDLQLLLEDVESTISKCLRTFSRKVTQRLTGTPVEDQRLS